MILDSLRGVEPTPTNEQESLVKNLDPTFDDLRSASPDFDFFSPIGMRFHFLTMALVHQQMQYYGSYVPVL